MWLDTVAGATVTGNEIEGVSHGITIYAYDNTDTVGNISKNLIHDTSDDCIWIADSFSGGTVSYNICYNTLDQFLDTYRAGAAALQQSNLNIYNNTVYNTTNACINIVKASSVNIKNNVLHTCGTSNGLSQQYHAIYITDTVNGNANITLPTLVSNYNDVYDAAGAKVGVYNSAESESYAWADWKTTKSQDANSIGTDPLFVSTVTPDFRLQSTSPAINAGVDVGLVTDYAGNPIRGLPDIGAYEFGLRQRYFMNP
jgi:hypothetical protein